jgi:hypothetical protein
MSNAWELKVDDKRSADSLFTFIIFCEDEISEYYYFKWFETPLIKVNVIRKQKSMLTNLRKAITFCTENGILVNDGANYKLGEEGIELWCVYDRDIESNLAEIAEKDNEFNLSISLAQQNDINVAWSNDAFELWILLHLMDIDANIDNTKKRIYYYEVLTNYFKNKENPNADLIKAIAHASFSYKKDLKSKTNFINIVRSEILPNTQKAIERSMALFEVHKTKLNHYDKKPCTTVHNLVINLLDKGKQQIPK